MGIHFSRYMPLLFIPPIVLLIWVMYRKFLTTRYRKSMLFRSITLILLLLSLASLHITKTAKETTTIFLSDLSNSTADKRTEVEAFIRDAIDAKTEKDFVGVIGFAGQTSVETQPSKNPLFRDFESNVDGEFTNIQNGLIMANALFPTDTKRRIVLITDGYENAGDARKQLAAVAGHATTIDFYDISDHYFDEVQLEAIEVPKKVEKNQTIDIKTLINSNIKTEGTLYIYANKSLKYKTDVVIEPGENNFTFSDQNNESGLITYSAQIVVSDDTYAQNNYVSTYTFVNDLPKILVIQGDDEQGLNIIGMLENSAYVDVTRPEEVPSTLESLIAYDGFIIANVPKEKLNDEFLSSLEEAIRLQGKGLLVTGGESSYGPGGYSQTLLETMLPINMDAKPKEEKPNLALVLVIDKSGSMSEVQYGVSKIELAKEAAIRSTDALDDKDYLGVIGFDSLPSWVLEPVKASDKKKIESSIALMGPGGGTSIQPALSEAVKKLKTMDAGLKHIILLTDGQAETTGYSNLLDQMQTEKITLSAVAVGDGADKKLLKALAQYGNGRYYETGVFSDIPSIFTKEAFMAGKKYLNTVTFTPTLTADSPIMTGITALPTLDGYVATSKKDTGKVILSGPDNDPILASWQYGLGRTVAFTSDMKGIWSKQWLGWDANQNFWINVMSWIVQQNLNTNYSVEGYTESGKGIIQVQSLVKGNDYASLEGLLTSPNGDTRTITLDATAPGVYQGDFTPDGEGTYLVSLSLGEGEQKEQVITALSIGYSKEFDFFSDRTLTIEEMAKITQGTVITDPKRVFDSKLEAVTGSIDLSRFLLLLAFISFMLEIILRKFKPPVQQVKEKMAVTKEKIETIVHKAEMPKPESTSHVDALLDTKRKHNR